MQSLSTVFSSYWTRRLLVLLREHTPGMQLIGASCVCWSMHVFATACDLRISTVIQMQPVATLLWLASTVCTYCCHDVAGTTASTNRLSSLSIPVPLMNMFINQLPGSTEAGEAAACVEQPSELCKITLQSSAREKREDNWSVSVRQAWLIVLPSPG